MGKLYIGNTSIAINHAIRQVQKNLQELQVKRARIKPTSYAGGEIISFYEEKIASQKITLDWLEKAL